jgi:branched-chain amino acid transport system substrate-binding protein
VEGAVFTALYHRELPHPFSYDFARRYEETFGAPPGSFAALGFDAATLVLSRWAEGETSREDVMQGLRSLRNVPALTGVLSVDPDDGVVRRPHLLTVDHGQITSLD